MNKKTIDVIPREVKTALILLWVALLAGAVSFVPFFVKNWSSILDQPASLWLETLGAYLVSILLLVALARGYGWIRWLFVFSITIMLLKILTMYSEWSQMYEQLRMFVYVEPIVFILRLIAIVLLFRPAANSWYAYHRQSIQHNPSTKRGT